VGLPERTGKRDRKDREERDFGFFGSYCDFGASFPHPACFGGAGAAAAAAAAASISAMIHKIPLQKKRYKTKKKEKNEKVVTEDSNGGRLVHITSAPPTGLRCTNEKKHN
jgi:hypothetical protein